MQFTAAPRASTASQLPPLPLTARPTRRPAKRSRPIREGSSVGWAVKILRQLGRPVEVGELAKMIGHDSGMAVSKTTLVSNLSRYVKADDTFTRPSPGHYGLKEWQGVQGGDLAAV